MSIELSPIVEEARLAILHNTQWNCNNCNPSQWYICDSNIFPRTSCLKCGRGTRSVLSGCYL